VWGERIVRIGAILAILLTCSLTVFAQPPAEGFVPVEQLPVQEQIPAAPLVMLAYAIAWFAVFAYLWSIWRRLGNVEREIAEVSRRIEAGARR
jgi:CcmD family protein